MLKAIFLKKGVLGSLGLGLRAGGDRTPGMMPGGINGYAGGAVMVLLITRDPDPRPFRTFAASRRETL